MNKNSKKLHKEKRHRKVRAKINGTEDKPRLCVFRSNKHIYAQIIDDNKGITITFASDLEIKDSKKDKNLASQEPCYSPLTHNKKINLAQKVGELIADKAKDKKITRVVFDRGGFRYHGRVKTLADAARKQGLKF